MSVSFGTVVRAATLGAIMLVAIEGATRFDDWARFGVAFSSNVQAMDELLVIDSLGAHARPGAQYRQFRINALGLRGAEIPPERLRTARLVVVSGASESFGLYEAQGKEWPRQLEDSLRTHCARDVVVGNAAFAGMSLPTVIQDVERRLRPLEPSVIVYYPTPMQYLEETIPVAAKPREVPTNGATGFRWRARKRFRDAIKNVTPAPILDLLRKREIAAAQSGMSAGPGTSAPMDRLDAFELNLRRLVGAIRAADAMPALGVHQNRFFVREGVEQERWLRAWEKFYPQYTGNTILVFEALAAERTRQVARDSAVVLIDPTVALRRERPVPFADFSHFTDRGAAIMGGTAARAIAGSVCGPR